DPDVDIDDAYFTGEEAPGGDNPTPDQDVVEDIGKSLGVTYNDSEELKGANKLEERGTHRWELDPASSEDYKDRKSADSSSVRLRLSNPFDQRQHFLADDVDVLTGRIDDERIVGHVERGRGARAVEFVALREKGCDVGNRSRHA